MPTDYMSTRCPAWCDRILMTPQVKDIIQSNDWKYDMIGESACMGDHKVFNFLNYFNKLCFKFLHKMQLCTTLFNSYNTVEAPIVIIEIYTHTVLEYIKKSLLYTVLTNIFLSLFNNVAHILISLP